jgi:hypothetical protein
VPTSELGEPLVERVDRVLDAPGRCETERTRDAWPTRSNATCAAERAPPLVAGKSNIETSASQDHRQRAPKPRHGPFGRVPIV